MGFPEKFRRRLAEHFDGVISIKGLEGYLYYESLHFELFSKIQIQNLKFLKHIAVDDQPKTFSMVTLSGRSDFA